LDGIEIASPCSADWNEMEGNERVRFCQDCQKRVFNLSAMTKAEAETLIQQVEGLCVRLYRRTDGTVISEDCPIGLRRTKQVTHAMLSFLYAGVAMVIAILFGHAIAKDKKGDSTLRRVEPFATIINWFCPTPPPTPPPSRCVMGKMK
jgi:hypothetical protein